MTDFERAQKTLEFDKIIEMLADCAMTDGAKTMARRLTPCDNLARLRRLQSETTDAKKMAVVRGAPSFEGVRAIEDAVERAVKGAALTPRELLDCAGVLRATRRVQDYGAETTEGSLVERFARLLPNRRVEDRITRALPAEDMVADEASPALSDIRRGIRRMAQKMRDQLQTYISSNTYSKYLQENIITMRGGRYVIPVKSEYRGEIKGLIHDTSASGATVFIEPFAVVEANNQLRELERKEAREIERILAELSALVAEIADSLLLNYQNLTELAFLFAKAELSVRMDATEAIFTPDRGLSLVRARHPLLDPKKVVPITISLGEEWDTLVITGPNTGGKTVSLKTVGLFVLMAQSGLHLPVEESSRLCVFSQVLADIGDAQSIEQSLSTFSSHMVNIVSITERVGEASLVLFDELGAGTDPVEGAALAIAVLEFVQRRGAMCVATTHYAELKAYALETPRFCNASCEFDVETLRPTYRLIVGTPGKSNAFAISEKLGLHQQIVDRARHYVSGEEKTFEKMLARLDRSRAEMEKKRREAEQLLAETEIARKREEAERAQRMAETQREIDRARREAEQLLTSARATSEFVFGQLEQAKKAQEQAGFADRLDEARRAVKRSLRETDLNIDPLHTEETPARPADYKLVRPLQKGDAVWVCDLACEGTVLTPPDKSGQVQIQAGVVRTKRSVDLLMFASDVKKPKQKPERSKYRNTEHKHSATYDIARTFSVELDLRGKNGEEGWRMTDKYLDDAVIAGVPSVRLIHGKGTGALRKALWEFLRVDARVKGYRLGAYGEGDTGVTVVELK